MALTRDFTDMIVTRGTGKKLSQDISELTSSVSSNTTSITDLQKKLVPMVTLLPTADETTRGKIILMNNGFSLADTVFIGVKNSDGTYGWKQITLT
jgi:hypothetical protein